MKKEEATAHSALPLYSYIASAFLTFYGDGIAAGARMKGQFCILGTSEVAQEHY
jgi:hypothetical protein